MGQLSAGIIFIILGLCVALTFFLKLSADGYVPDASLEAFDHGVTDPDMQQESGRVVISDAPNPYGKNFNDITDAKRNGRVDDGTRYQRHRGLLSLKDRRNVEKVNSARSYLNYTAEKGESLKEIAARYLGNRNLWRKIQSHNPGAGLTTRFFKGGEKMRIPLWLAVR